MRQIIHKRRPKARIHENIRTRHAPVRGGLERRRPRRRRRLLRLIHSSRSTRGLRVAHRTRLTNKNLTLAAIPHLHQRRDNVGVLGQHMLWAKCQPREELNCRRDHPIARRPKRRALQLVHGKVGDDEPRRGERDHGECAVGAGGEQSVVVVGEHGHEDGLGGLDAVPAPARHDGCPVVLGAYPRLVFVPLEDDAQLAKGMVGGEKPTSVVF